jgi:thiamine kinase-like enzyme
MTPETLLQPHRSPSLEAADRQFLLSVVSELEATLAPLTTARRPLHGSPHGANRLLSTRGPMLLDFETACLGPVEWDLAALADKALGSSPMPTMS